MKTGLVSAWLVEVVLISYRGVKQGNNGTDLVPLPLPSQFTATLIIFGGLSLLPDEAQGVAAVFGWGIVIATFLNLWQPLSGNATSATKPQVATSGLETAAGNVAA